MDARRSRRHRTQARAGRAQGHGHRPCQQRRDHLRLRGLADPCRASQRRDPMSYFTVIREADPGDHARQSPGSIAGVRFAIFPRPGGCGATPDTVRAEYGRPAGGPPAAEGSSWTAGRAAVGCGRRMRYWPTRRASGRSSASVPGEPGPHPGRLPRGTACGQLSGPAPPSLPLCAAFFEGWDQVLTIEPEPGRDGESGVPPCVRRPPC